MSDNLELHRQGHAAFSRGDMEFLAKLFADDIVWHAAGRSPVSGDHKGRDAVMAFFQKVVEMSGGTLTVEDQFFMGDADRTVALFKLTGQRNGKTLDSDFCEVIRWQDGQVAENWGFAFDQYAHDEFWS
jgi:ketosteroid isomerase-like protein